MNTIHIICGVVGILLYFFMAGLIWRLIVWNARQGLRR